jgi:hypothetical protein
MSSSSVEEKESISEKILKMEKLPGPREARRIFIPYRQSGKIGHLKT